MSQPKIIQIALSSGSEVDAPILFILTEKGRIFSKMLGRPEGSWEEVELESLEQAINL